MNRSHDCHSTRKSLVKAEDFLASVGWTEWVSSKEYHYSQTRMHVCLYYWLYLNIRRNRRVLQLVKGQTKARQIFIQARIYLWEVVMVEIGSDLLVLCVLLIGDSVDIQKIRYLPCIIRWINEASLLLLQMTHAGKKYVLLILPQVVGHR